jgi:lactoylglutathione lyase
MDMGLRLEIFPADLDGTVDFYTRVLGFALVTDQRDTNHYVALKRGSVTIGAVERPAEPEAERNRHPPVGIEIVLEVDDLGIERDRVVRAGWPLDEDLAARPWGLTDFRLLDPSGYYLRVTDRPARPQS